MLDSYWIIRESVRLILVYLLVLLIKKGYKIRDLKVLHILTVCLYSYFSSSECTENAPITLSPVACTAPPLLFTLPYKRHDFRKYLANIKCVFYFLYNFSL